VTNVTVWAPGWDWILEPVASPVCVGECAEILDLFPIAGPGFCREGLVGGGWWQAELGPRSEGAYRVVVGGEGAVDPVSDVFAVVSGSGA
jgi:hypothetical protein